MKTAMNLSNNEYDFLLTSFVSSTTRGGLKKGEFNDSLVCLNTYGQYDYIIVETPEKEKQFLGSIFEKTAEMSIKIKDKASIHNIFSSINEISYRNENNFWDKCKSKKAPFFFAIMIQLYETSEEFYKNCTEEIEDVQKALRIEGKNYYNQCAERINKKLNETKYNKELKFDFDFVIYNCLNCSDLIVYATSTKYAEVVNLFQSINVYFDFFRYSFTVCGMNWEVIKELKELEPIPKVHICVVADNLAKLLKENENKKSFVKGKLEDAYGCNNVELSSRLGNEDFCFIVKCTDIRKHAEILGKNDFFGIKDDVSFVRIIFECKIKYYGEKEIGTTDKRNTDESIFNIIKYSNDDFDDSDSIRLPNVLKFSYQKSLIEVLRAIGDLEKNHYAGDIVSTIKNTFKMFCEKIKSYEEFDKELQNENKFVEKFQAFVKAYIKGIMSIINGSLQSNRVFFQVPGVSTVLYDTPSKLFTFYSAFIQKTVSILKDPPLGSDSELSPDYRFLFCPDICSSTEVDNLFCYDDENTREASNLPGTNRNRKLLKVDIDTKKLFEPEPVLLEMVHECAHLTGNTARKREIRVDRIIDVFCSSIINKLFFIPESIKNKDKIRKYFEFTKDNKNDFCLQLFRYIKPKIKEIYKEKEKLTEINLIISLYPVVNNIYDSSQDFLNRDSEIQEIIGRIQNFINCSNLKRENVPYFELMQLFEKNIYDIKVNLLLSCKKAAYSLFFFFYSDNVMIRLLDLNIYEYLSLLYSQVKDNIRHFEEKEYLDGSTAQRIVAVIRANTEVSKYFENPKKSQKLNKFNKDINDFIEKINNSFDIRGNFSLDNRSIRYCEEYLKVCNEEIDKIIYPQSQGKKHEVNDKVDELREIYKNATGNNIRACMDKIFTETERFCETVKEEYTTI
jgi:hypothetical protein